MKDIRLYNEKEMQMAYNAGVQFAKGDSDNWKSVFEGGERRGASFMDQNHNAPNWIEFMRQEKDEGGQKFKSWLRANEKILGISLNKTLFAEAATSSLIINKDGLKPITMEAVEEAVACVFDTTIDELRYNPTRKREIVNPRQLAAYLCYFHTHETLEAIGANFGGRDHACVLNAARKFADHASNYGPDKQKLTQAYKLLLQGGYAIHHYVSKEDMPNAVGRMRKVIKPIEIEI